MMSRGPQTMKGWESLLSTATKSCACPKIFIFFERHQLRRFLFYEHRTLDMKTAKSHRCCVTSIQWRLACTRASQIFERIFSQVKKFSPTYVVWCPQSRAGMMRCLWPTLFALHLEKYTWVGRSWILRWMLLSPEVICRIERRTGCHSSCSDVLWNTIQGKCVFVLKTFVRSMHVAWLNQESERKAGTLSTWASEVRGQGTPWILIFVAKKAFLVLSGEKNSLFAPLE